jgi:hypothetical protein
VPTPQPDNGCGCPGRSVDGPTVAPDGPRTNLSPDSAEVYWPQSRWWTRPSPRSRIGRADGALLVHLRRLAPFENVFEVARRS